eukprot:856817_1
MRVSYHTEPKILIKQALMMTIRKNNRVEPANRRFVAGVGYSNNLSPIICLHKDFLLDVVLAFYIPRHGTDDSYVIKYIVNRCSACVVCTDGMAIELLLKVNDDIYSLFSHGSGICLCFHCAIRIQNLLFHIAYSTQCSTDSSQCYVTCWK